MPIHPLSAPSRALIDRLIAERPGLTGLERLAADTERDVIFDRSDWVSAWVDTGHRIDGTADGLTATRAITAQGRLIWLVRSPGYQRAYHSRAATAGAAMAEAATAWRRRREMRAHRDELRGIVRDLRRGRLRYPISVEDAYASPLCAEGVDGFLRAIGMARFRVFPGWFIAWCFALDRQVGFVIWEAHRRHMAERAVGAGA